VGAGKGERGGGGGGGGVRFDSRNLRVRLNQTGKSWRDCPADFVERVAAQIWWEDMLYRIRWRCGGERGAAWGSHLEAELGAARGNRPDDSAAPKERWQGGRKRSRTALEGQRMLPHNACVCS
jgi:hypothetical protein